jgi:hypothetical protein
MCRTYNELARGQVDYNRDDVFNGRFSTFKKLVSDHFKASLSLAPLLWELINNLNNAICTAFFFRFFSFLYFHYSIVSILFVLYIF